MSIFNRTCRDPIDGMTPRDRAFVTEYLVDYNAYRAAKAVGFSETYARQASGWVKREEVHPGIYHAVQAAIRERSIRTQITADKVLERYWQIATADPNELTQIRRLNCRHCHGVDFKFQWRDELEYEYALANAVDQQRKDEKEGLTPGPLPNDEGGYGFQHDRDANPECPQCRGEGKVEVYFGDTRNLSEQGQALFAGVKQTKDGLEIKMHDQLAALNQVARHLGMFNDKLLLGNDPENPLESLLKSLPGATLRPVPQDDKDKK